MRKFLALFLSLALVFTLASCGKATKTGTAPDSNMETEKPKEPESNDFYKSMQTDFRPIAVMIDNDDYHARPQLGLESAYAVYEMVVEGAATRFMALFKDASLEKIGPIRSSRHYFLDYVQEHDARYVHSGWSDKAAIEIKNNKINNINGLYDNIFWRDRTYDNTWHNLYTGLDKVEELASKKNYRDKSDVKVFDYLLMPEDLKNGTECTYLAIPYAGFYDVEFKYNAETKLYERYVNDQPHKSQTGDILTAMNILVYSLTNVPLNDGIYAPRQDINTVGSGEGYYLTQGKSVKIKWQKDSRSSITKYTLEDGSPLKLNPGNTYIQIAPTSIEYTFE